MNLGNVRDWLALLRANAVPVGVIVVTLIGWGVAEGYLAEREQAARAELSSVMRDVRGLRQQIDELSGNTDFVADNMPVYRRALDAGFTGPQERLQASRTIEIIAGEFGLNELRYEFQPPQRIDLDTAGSAQVALVSTPIVLNIDAVLDSRVFAFLDALRERLPGYTVLRTLQINRGPGDPASWLGRLRAGENPNLITAAVTLDWTTMDLPEGEGNADAQG